mmetsp:Transcript_76238/g.215760  ORF Transcript_76238/g.215760 Transcript_76238/m.215760 type:complete len:202 (-) Transcript_76238:857-1462(-)
MSRAVEPVGEVRLQPVRQVCAEMQVLRPRQQLPRHLTLHGLARLLVVGPAIDLVARQILGTVGPVFAAWYAIEGVAVRTFLLLALQSFAGRVEAGLPRELPLSRHQAADGKKIRPTCNSCCRPARCAPDVRVLGAKDRRPIEPLHPQAANGLHGVPAVHGRALLALEPLQHAVLAEDLSGRLLRVVREGEPLEAGDSASFT